MEDIGFCVRLLRLSDSDTQLILPVWASHISIIRAGSETPLPLERYTCDFEQVLVKCAQMEKGADWKLALKELEADCVRVSVSHDLGHLSDS